MRDADTIVRVGPASADRGKRVRTPVQARARQSVEAIISAAAAVLDERGLPGFNTKAVAARAGVNVATLYQYFENKQAILVELARRADRERTSFLRSLLEETVAADDWEPFVRRAVDGLVELRRTSPTAAALRRALVASPDLQDVRFRSLQRDAVAIADVLVGRRPDLDVARAHAVGMLYALTTDTTVDLAVDGDRIDTHAVDELVAMLVAHLRSLLTVPTHRTTSSRYRR